MKKLTALLLLLGTSLTHAELTTLDNQALQAVEAQAGADLSLNLRLNHVDKKWNTTTSVWETAPNSFDDGPGGVCDKAAVSDTGLGYCHLGISVNKRFVKETALGNGNWSVPESDPTQGSPARKLWLVFKGIQGTVNIQKLGLDGVDLVYKNDSGTEKIKPAIQLSFDATLPILIRNLGYNALAIEMDNFTSYIDPTTKQVVENTTSSTPAQDYGYLKATTYASNHTSVYDQNKETGFMGLRMNGNLALQGKIMMFGCDGSHPRC